MRTYDGITSRWKFFIGMNQEGKIKPVPGFNISREDGSLYIDKVQPCDVRRFMCTVERVNGTSPKRHFVTLRIINQNGNRASSTTSTPKTGQTPPKKDRDQSSHSIAVTFAILGWLVAAAEGVAIAVILYKFRSRKLREISDRCTGRAESPAPA